MATKDKILETIASLNPGIDLIGPITDVIATPIGQEIDDLDDRLLATKKLLSSTFDENWTDEELESITATRGVFRDPGAKSTGNITFRFSTVPGGIDVPAGTELTTIDSLYQYVLVEDFSPTNDEIQASFTASTGLYELAAPIEAITIGEKYNIAATRIRKIRSVLPSGTTIINLEAMTGGADLQTNEDLWISFQDQGIISDSSSNEGRRQTILAEFPDINDVFISNAVVPFNPSTLEDPQILTYTIGENLIEVTEEFTVQSSKVTLNFDYVTEVTSIKHGTEDIILYELEGNVVTILEPIADGEIVTVTYTYNQLLIDLQIFLDNQENNLFNYRMRVIEAIKEDLKIAVEVKFQSSYINSINVSDIEDIILEFYNTLYFTEEDLQTQELTNLIRNSFAGVVDILVTEFTPVAISSYLVGFPVFIKPPSYPVLQIDNLSVSISAG